MAGDTFHLFRIFKSHYNVTITEGEIARLYEISEEKAREYIKEDIEAGMIFKLPSSPTYYLTFRGLHVLCQMRMGCTLQ